MPGMQDRFVNLAYATVTMSGANALTFSEIQTGLAMFEKVAWIIHRIVWYIPAATVQEIVANTDFMQLGFTGNNKMSDLSIDDAAVYDLIELVGMVSGAPAVGFIVKSPAVSDFSTLPAGGLIIPPRPLYVAANTAGFVAAGVVQARIYFTYKQLKADEYWELVEASRIIE